MINYWTKLEKLPDDKLLKRCLNIQKDLHTRSRSSWFSRVINILNMCGIVFDENSHNNLHNICRTVKLTLYQKQQEQIFAEINNTTQQPKLRTYKHIKTDYRLEPYLLLNMNRKTCSKIARFRISSHNLRIETGRHEKPKIPSEDRTCLKCNLNEVEDEIHCLVTCPSYSRKSKYDSKEIYW